MGARSGGGRARRALACLGWLVASSLAATSATAQVSVASNGFYDVAVDDGGAYAIRMGSAHPGPVGAPLLRGGDLLAPGTSWNTVRSYRSGAEWLLSAPASGAPSASPGFTCAAVDGSMGPRQVIPMLDAGGRQVGVRTQWSVRDGIDLLSIAQEVVAEGTTTDDARVRVSVSVTNDDTVPAEIGIRFLWDLQVASGGAAYLGRRPADPPLEPYLSVETDFAPPDFESFDACDQDSPSLRAPLYCVAGTVSGSLGPVPPDLFQFASADDVERTCFEYATSGRPAGATDAATSLAWGATRANAVVLAPGATFTATEHLFAFERPPTPLCEITQRVAGDRACEAVVTLDASGSSSSRCDSGLEFRFVAPDGSIAADWSANPRFDAGVAGTWTVDARCAAHPTCSATTSRDVRIDLRPRVASMDAIDHLPCSRGILLEWDAFFPAPPHRGTYWLHHSRISCEDALAQPPIAFGSTPPLHGSFLDTVTGTGGAFYYVLVLEDAGSVTSCSPRGSFNGGAIDVRCAGPVTDVTAADEPRGACWPLRVSHVGRDVTLDWGTVRPLLPGEHFHVLRAVGAALPPFSRVGSEGSVATTYADAYVFPDTLFFDVRIASECERVSRDDEPAGRDRPGWGCP